ncbi:hypothetical protein [uncultured Butyricimonas sp.]|uniref:hypothetical protein n=1 Tax=uncultured Butyricimonas sp. TaxID=1268785 RepID=UPI0026DB992E|nr:hypothetical protein [uncultured Butyricimonas sp.]
MILGIHLAKFECFVYLFFYIFGLQLPVVRTSSLLLLVLLPIRFLFLRGGFDIAKRMFLHPYVVRLLGMYLFVMFYMILLTTMHLELDLTLLPTLINVMLHFIVGIFLVSLLVYRKYTLDEVLSLLIGIFVVQSVIQIMAFFSPSLQGFIQLFQGNSTIEVASKFAGRRGLALAGTVFFGLAILYGLIFLFFIKRCVDREKFTYRDVVCGIILFIGGFFTGRTFFVGVGVAGLYFLCSSFSFLYKVKTLCRIFLFIVLGAMVIWMSLTDSLQYKVYNLLLYAFEFLFNYLEKGTLETTSSSTLFDDMYFSISLPTFFVGDGLYTGYDGAYYLHTDAGYMRNILYIGVGGFVLLILLDVFLVFGRQVLREGKMLKFGLFILFYLGIIHVKGEVFGYSVMLHCFLFIYYLSYVFIEQRILYIHDQCHNSNL